MKISLFGKNLFEIKKSVGGVVYNTAIDKLAKSEFLIDFLRDTGGDHLGWGESTENPLSDWAVISTGNGGAVTVPKLKTDKKGKPKAEKPVEPPKEITPKEAYTLKLLNDEGFVLKTDPAYVDEQIANFRDKLGMIKPAEFDMNRGTIEIGSILSRMENRKKYKDYASFYEQFPYTFTSRIQDLVKKHAHLKLGQVEQFLADMPKEATDVMKEYTAKTKNLCGKKPVFYIIANKKDFQKTESRRDPILLAQSPFGHFWQILGAWDEEMLLIDEL